MEFLTDAWAASLDAALQDVEVDPAVDLTIDYRAGDFTHRLVISGGRAQMTTDVDGNADVRITADPLVAAAINAGEQSALEAFMEGSVVVGGDLRLVMEHQSLLERLGAAFGRDPGLG